MNRRFFILFAVAASLVCATTTSADAAGGRRGGFGHRSGFKGGATGVKGSFGHGGFGHGGFGHGGVGLGFGFGGCDDFLGYAELYRELLRNVPYFALHPPVYYSYPVPRTYGYSPFAYPPYVMTPDVACAEPLEIINPHVQDIEAKPSSSTPKADRSAATNAPIEPLVIINPFVAPNQAVAQVDR
jgi:hypothetical protein